MLYFQYLRPVRHIVNGSDKIFIFMRQEDALLKWDNYVFL